MPIKKTNIENRVEILEKLLNEFNKIFNLKESLDEKKSNIKITLLSAKKEKRLSSLNYQTRQLIRSYMTAQRLGLVRQYVLRLE